MKNFRTLEQAKKDLQIYMDYILLIEQYEPQNFVQRVIQEYAYQGSMNRTAEILNRRGYDIDNRPIEPNDIKQIITSRPIHEDSLHKEIRRLYFKKTKSSRVKSKLYY